MPTVNVETSKAAGKRDKKCTPARRRKAEASVQTEANCLPSTSRRPRRRGNRKKNARRRGKDRQGLACKRRQIARHHSRDVQAGGETGKKCTPARRRKAEASVQTEAKSLPSSSRRPSRGRHGKKNARRRDEERQKPACKRRHNLRHHSRDVQAGGETGKKCTPARQGPAGASVQTEADCAPSASRRPRRRGNRIKNARRRGEERQRPACTRRQIAHRQRRDVQGGGETG